MTMVTTGERLWGGLGPTVEQLEDEGSSWFVRDELRELYLEAARGVDRAKVREVETNVGNGLGGNRSITSSWLLGLRAEARDAAGLDPIPLDRLSDYRVTEGWPSDLASTDALVGWALHQLCAADAVNALDDLRMMKALEVSVGSARCPACSVPVAGPSSNLCSDCATVLEVVRLDRARELGRERVEGKVTRADLVERWLATQ